MLSKAARGHGAMSLPSTGTGTLDPGASASVLRRASKAASAGSGEEESEEVYSRPILPGRVEKAERGSRLTTALGARSGMKSIMVRRSVSVSRPQ
eukprot:1210641-Rhodomonas_salina.1